MLRVDLRKVFDDVPRQVAVGVPLAQGFVRVDSQRARTLSPDILHDNVVLALPSQDTEICQIGEEILADPLGLNVGVAGIAKVCRR